MEMTPRLANTFVFLAQRRRQRDLAELLHVLAASHGDVKAIRSTLRALES